MTVALFNEPASHLDLHVAVLARLNSTTGLAGLQVPWIAYRRDKAPESGGDYVILDVQRTAGGNRRLGGGIAPSSWYATTVAVGTSVGNTSVLLRRSFLALDGFVVTVGGVESTALDFSPETETVIEQDEYDQSLWSASRTYTFAF